MTNTTTFIDSSQCARIKDGIAGEFAEIVNKTLCGAENVVGMLRWLDQGEYFEPSQEAEKYQLIFLLEGSGIINLNDQDYKVAKGNGLYLEPTETASIKQTGTGQLKCFHLVILKQST